MYYLCYCEKDVQVHARPPLVADKIVINPANNHPFSRQNIPRFRIVSFDFRTEHIPVGLRKSSLQQNLLLGPGSVRLRKRERKENRDYKRNLIAALLSTLV